MTREKSKKNWIDDEREREIWWLWKIRKRREMWWWERENDMTIYENEKWYDTDMREENYSKKWKMGRKYDDIRKSDDEREENYSRKWRLMERKSDDEKSWENEDKWRKYDDMRELDKKSDDENQRRKSYRKRDEIFTSWILVRATLKSAHSETSAPGDTQSRVYPPGIMSHFSQYILSFWV